MLHGKTGNKKPATYFATLLQNALKSHVARFTTHIKPVLQQMHGLLEARLVLTSVKYHGNLYILIPLNQRLALTRLRAGC